MLEGHRTYLVYLNYKHEKIYIQTVTAPTPILAKAKAWDLCTPTIKHINPDARINQLSVELADSIINKDLL